MSYLCVDEGEVTADLLLETVEDSAVTVDGAGVSERVSIGG